MKNWNPILVPVLFIGIRLAAAGAGGRRQIQVALDVSPEEAFLQNYRRNLAWAVVFGVGLQLVPHEGASSPYGGLGLIALFSGFFVMMGFLWSVIGE